jgi:hypothetical protein
MSRTVDLASQYQAERHESEVAKLLSWGPSSKLLQEIIGIKPGSNSVAIGAFSWQGSEDLLSMVRPGLSGTTEIGGLVHSPQGAPTQLSQFQLLLPFLLLNSLHHSSPPS